MSDNEREGEDEPGENVEEGGEEGDVVVADEDLGALGMVPEKREEEDKPADKAADAAITTVEAVVPFDDAAIVERVDYLRRIGRFYKERCLYYRGKRQPGASTKAKADRQFQRTGQEPPCNATYSEDGSTLTLVGKTGNLKDTIQLQGYRSPTKDEQDAAETIRLQRIKKAEQDYEQAIDQLHIVYKTGIGADMKQAQRRVAEADRILHRTRYPLKTIVQYPSVEIRHVDFEQPRNEHKTYVYALHLATQKLQSVYAIPYKGEEKEPEDVVVGIKGQRPIIFASKPVGKYGFLSSFYAHPFQYKGTEYKNAYQAIMSVIAHAFGDDEKAEEILATEDPSEIDLTWDTLEGVTRKAWELQLTSLIIKVNRAKFVKLPALAAKLLKTGDARIAAVPPENETDPFQGIGLTEENPDSLKKSKWKGKNVFGLALEQIREELGAKETANEKPKVAEPTAEQPTAEQPAAEPTAEPAAAPKRLLRRLVPVSATEAVSLITKGASAATDAAVQGASTVAGAAAQGAATVAGDARAVANAATKAASAVTNVATKAASAVTDAASTAAASLLKAVSPS